MKLNNVKVVAPARVKDATIAQLEITRGVVGPNSEYMGVWQWLDHKGFPQLKGGKLRACDYTSVIQVELGDVTELTLRLVPLQGSGVKEQSIPLGPAAGTATSGSVTIARASSAVAPSPAPWKSRRGSRTSTSGSTSR